MSYLRARDYILQIQDANLQQIISSNPEVQAEAERVAQAEVISYLVQKYDTTQEFTDTNPFLMSLAYPAKARIEINFPAYVPATNYVTNDLVINAGIGYVCTGATTGTFAPAKWTAIGTQYDLFYAKLPKAEFDCTKYYKVGDQVFWKDNTYTCKIATPVLDHGTILQYGSYSALPSQNVFPDDPLVGVTYWGAPTAYVVTAGTLPTNAAWTKGDNRSQQLLLYMIDIILYQLHTRISPRNIPPLRFKRYDGSPDNPGNGGAIGWLKMAARGEVTASLPILQPRQGSRIRYGGNVKNINSY